MIEYKNRKNRIVDLMLALLAILAALVCIFPVLHCTALSFSGAAAADAGKVTIWPVDLQLTAYKKLLEEKTFFTAFGISVKRVLLGGGINMILIIIMAYPLSKDKREFPQRNIYMWFLVFTMLFNGGTIPWYITIKNYGLLDTMWALVLPCAVQVYNIILMMNFFKGIPKELEEAAVMDGAGPFTTLLKIYLPVSLPGLATVGLFVLLYHWNNYFDGIILMNSASKLPLQSYVQQFVVSVDAKQNMTTEQLLELAKMSSRTLNAAKIVVTMVPILVVYPFLQKYFTSGLVMGAVKG